GGFISSRIHKYDFDCNLIWSKEFGYTSLSANSVTSDELGNIYLIIHNTQIGLGQGPFDVDGFMMNRGINFYKMSSDGDILWHRNIGGGINQEVGHYMQNIFYRQNTLYVTGTFHQNLIFNNDFNFSYPYVEYPRAFIARYNLDGNVINATVYEETEGYNRYEYSEIDNQGNVYLTRNHYTNNNTESIIDKYDF